MISDPVIQVMHQTVRELMLRSNGLSQSLNIHLGPENDAKHRITMLCLRYIIVFVNNLSELRLPLLGEWLGTTFLSFLKFLNERCFLSYALSYLARLIKAGSYQTPEFDTLRDAINKDAITRILLGEWLSETLAGQ
jgi:hypothetical protein